MDSLNDEPQVSLSELTEDNQEIVTPAEASVEEKSIPAAHHTAEEGDSSIEHIYSTPKKTSSSSSDAPNKYISSFFIGISFRKDLYRADISFVVKVSGGNSQISSLAFY